MRLPPKKSKQKQVVIDYTSLESAKASAPASYDYESWLEGSIILQLYPESDQADHTELNRGHQARGAR